MLRDTPQGYSPPFNSGFLLPEERLITLRRDLLLSLGSVATPLWEAWLLLSGKRGYSVLGEAWLLCPRRSVATLRPGSVATLRPGSVATIDQEAWLLLTRKRGYLKTRKRGYLKTRKRG